MKLNISPLFSRTNKVVYFQYFKSYKLNNVTISKSCIRCFKSQTTLTRKHPLNLIQDSTVPSFTQSVVKSLAMRKFNELWPNCSKHCVYPGGIKRHTVLHSGASGFALSESYLNSVSIWLSRDWCTSIASLVTRLPRLDAVSVVHNTSTTNLQYKMLGFFYYDV